MTTPRDAIGLSERLRDRFTVGAYVQPTHLHCPDYSKGRALLEEAATALDALQARVKELEGELTDTQAALTGVNSDWAKAESRALRAEQERDEALERAAQCAECIADEYDATSFTSVVADQVAALRSKEQAAHEIAAAIRRLAAGTEKEKRE